MYTVASNKKSLSMGRYCLAAFDFLSKAELVQKTFKSRQTDTGNPTGGIIPSNPIFQQLNQNPIKAAFSLKRRLTLPLVSKK